MQKYSLSHPGSSNCFSCLQNLSLRRNLLPLPTQTGQDAEWLSAEAGMRHTVAIKKDATLWAWGLNQNGQLGNGKNKNNHTPVQIGN
jgi:alpha-tubulin suppressor-like RCC1 family protein